MTEPTAPGALMAAEIAEQPEVFERVLTQSPADVAQVARRGLVVAGRRCRTRGLVQGSSVQAFAISHAARSLPRSAGPGNGSP